MHFAHRTFLRNPRLDISNDMESFQPFCFCGVRSALKSTKDIAPEKRSLPYCVCSVGKCRFFQWAEEADLHAKRRKSETVSDTSSQSLTYQYVRRKKNEAFDFLSCKFCLSPCVDPVINSCKHFFCRACFPVQKTPCPTCGKDVSLEGSRFGFLFFLDLLLSTTWQRLPDSTLVKLLGELEVFCLYKHAGCSWIGARGGLCALLYFLNLSQFRFGWPLREGLQVCASCRLVERQVCGRDPQVLRVLAMSSTDD